MKKTVVRFDKIICLPQNSSKGSSGPLFEMIVVVVSVIKWTLTQKRCKTVREKAQRQAEMMPKTLKTTVKEVENDCKEMLNNCRDTTWQKVEKNNCGKRCTMTADTQNNRKVTEKSPLIDTKRCKSFFCLWEEKSCENNYCVRKIKAKSLVEKNNISYIFNTKN